MGSKTVRACRLPMHVTRLSKLTSLDFVAFLIEACLKECRNSCIRHPSIRRPGTLRTLPNLCGICGLCTPRIHCRLCGFALFTKDRMVRRITALAMLGITRVVVTTDWPVVNRASTMLRWQIENNSGLRLRGRFIDGSLVADRRALGHTATHFD